MNGCEHKCSDISNFNISLLDEIRTKNINILIIGTLNISSLFSKFDQLKVLIQGKIDILIIAETKLDSNFFHEQFVISDYLKLCTL